MPQSWVEWIRSLRNKWAYEEEFAPRVRGPYSDEVDAFLTELMNEWTKRERKCW
jgi:hypothetical protein